ncbi:Nuclear transcription factor Y subunit A-7 [Nymphaea thermarum]|nr:Nuclear transcription factor Y subunit A-7 [Nymphaea thermarum]
MEEDMRDGKQRGSRGTAHWDENPTFVGLSILIKFHIENVEQGQAVYPFPDPYYGSYVAAYGAQVMIHPHMMGVHQAGLPLPSDAVEEPVYVNAKQYHGILRRRQSRAKAESENKMIKSRKPYLHESRHLHALRRARGCGGRFLNSKTEAHEIQASGGAPPSQPISTSNSDDS